MPPTPCGKEAVDATAALLLKAVDRSPETALLTGTGLGDVAEAMALSHRWPFRELPHFPETTVAGHPGELLNGTLGGHGLWVCRGRFHLYEGYPPETVTFPVRVLRALGVTRIVLTNAAGGINPAFTPGDLMVITDHINLTGENPLRGPNEDAWGTRFPDMSRAYAPDWAQHAALAASDAGLRVQQGVYAGLKGPSLETPAEIRYLRSIGADAVGFSTVMETIAAVHAGIQVIGLSLITNVHDPNHPAPTTLAEVLAVAETHSEALAKAIPGIVAPTTGAAAF